VGDVAGLMLKNRMLLLCAFLLLVGTCLAAQTKRDDNRQPFDLGEIKDLLKGSVSPKRVAALVEGGRPERFGVNFELTEDVEKELRELGADDGLLLVISTKRVQPPDTTAQEWEAVRYGNDQNQLAAFLQRHPSGPFSDAARAQIEQIVWAGVNGCNDRSKLQAYLNQHSGGRYAQPAREQIEQLDWNSAFSSHDRARIQAYIDQYPYGRFRQQARGALEQIDWDAVKNSNDVQRLRAFLIAYPQGRYATLAKATINTRVSARPAMPVQARPKYCPLPDKLEFDYNTPDREKIGIWTGVWNVNPFRRFCVVITSINGNDVRGGYSWEDKGKGYEGGFAAFAGTMKQSQGGRDRSAQVISAKARGFDITLQFRANGNIWTTWQRPGYRMIETRVSKFK